MSHTEREDGQRWRSALGALAFAALVGSGIEACASDAAPGAAGAAGMDLPAGGAAGSGLEGGAGGAVTEDPIWSTDGARIELQCVPFFGGCVGQEAWASNAADLTAEQIDILSSMIPLPVHDSVPCDTTGYIVTVIDAADVRTEYWAGLSFSYCQDSRRELSPGLFNAFLATIAW
jgi:hypothetical protein